MINMIKRNVRKPLTAILLLALSMVLMLVGSRQTILGQTMGMSSLGDKPVTVALFRKGADDKYQKFASAKFKGTVEWDANGIVKGEDTFFELEFNDNPGKWHVIKKRELVKGRLVVTMDDDKPYTIYDLQQGFVGKIEPGRFVEEKPQQNPKSQSETEPGQKPAPSATEQRSLVYDRMLARDGAIVMKDFTDSYEGAGWVAGTVEKVEKDSITVHVEKGKKKLYRARINSKTSLCIDKKIVQDVSKDIQNLTAGHRVSVAFMKGTDIANAIVDQGYEIGSRLSSPTSGSSGGPRMPKCD